MAVYDADTDEFEVEDVCEESEGEEEPSCSVSGSLLDNSLGIGRVFIVSTARTTGGHRPSCTFEGQLYEVCVSSSGGAYLQKVLQGEEPEPLSLSLRYEPPSPKFSRLHPALTSYRVKLLQGDHFIYLHRGLPKVCLVDRQARCLSWGQLQLIMRDTQQLNAVLAVLRHADVQHRTVWPPQVSMLWLGAGNSESALGTWSEEEDMIQGSNSEVHATNEGGHRSISSSWWTNPIWHSASGHKSEWLAFLSPATMLLAVGSAVVVSSIFWRSYHRGGPLRE
ncbi:hypothetical protein CEUSTIGMA_g5963.t1 [Chlamydomonas eustigma]|uniref:Uncharacterized protein n=1 Tax=Chlamydomonas eustigma TaxID=1157962 RepID=A0A250X617_9CHLO|nr:hypothetical protein CEUSTIGMA_g5963.t1 [Chlamydomonas eustigma]|eukprot:GAX78523.1 hypothetical protein CEUSTIGMA_g5963.t1 [Chlamydomonas eustigma]